eukprot:765491-Hanusia_phi.AAC.1
MKPSEQRRLRQGQLAVSSSDTTIKTNRHGSFYLSDPLNSQTLYPHPPISVGAAPIFGPPPDMRPFNLIGVPVPHKGTPYNHSIRPTP